MFDLSNFFNTPGLKRFAMRTCLLEGEGSSRMLADLVDPRRPGAVVVDQAFQDDPCLQALLDGPRRPPVFTVRREPRTEDLDACLRTLEELPEWVVALGGGSTIDTAKAIAAHGLFGTYVRVGYGDLRQAGETALSRPPRLVALPTTAGSGSETSRYYLVTDSATGEKRVSRTWLVCPEFAILDPGLLARAPRRVLVAGAFDAFCHLWETLVCRQEASPLVQALSLEGICLGVAALDHWASRGPDPVVLAALQRASALGGVALSNVRTGFLHTAGEALARVVPLPHPHTLMVFFETNLLSCLPHVAPQARALLDRLEATLPGRFAAMEGLVTFWQQAFAKEGLLAEAGNALRARPFDPGIVVEALAADAVLATKEHPFPLRRDGMEDLVRRSIAQAAGW